MSAHIRVTPHLLLIKLNQSLHPNVVVNLLIHHLFHAAVELFLHGDRQILLRLLAEQILFENLSLSFSHFQRRFFPRCRLLLFLLLVLILRLNGIRVKIKPQGIEDVFVETFLGKGADLGDFGEGLICALLRVFDLVEAHFGRSVLESGEQGSVHLSIDLSWDVILQVSVCHFCVFEEAGHLSAHLFGSVYTSF